MKKIVCFIVFSIMTVQVQSKEVHDWIQNIGFYSAQGIDRNLVEIPRSIITFDMRREDTYLYALTAFIPLKQYKSFELGITPIIAKHTGIQSHPEINAAVTVKYTELFSKNDYINMDVACGIGLSYAFDTPVYERPIIQDDGSEKYYKFQSFLHFDAEIYTPSFSSVHLLLRVHHRSGIFGLIAPKHVGSNFLGVGVVYYFDR